VGLKLNGTHQLLAYADDVNLLGDNIDTLKKNTETLMDVTKKVGLEINVDKIKYMLLSRHQNVGRNQDIKIANRLFGNVSQLKYSGMTVKTPWPESASELYRLCDRRLSAKLVPTFAHIGCHVVSVTDPYSRILDFLEQKL
jgi:hypothetical protein